MSHELHLLSHLPPCDLPAFPVYPSSEDRGGRRYWVKYVDRKKEYFGPCSTDPTGALAWIKYIDFLAEKAGARERALAGIPRDCNHPEFPFFRGKHPNCEVWGVNIDKQAVSFGSIRHDPNGAIAWKLYDHELPLRKKGINPRQGFGPRRARARAWLLSAPFSKVGIAIMDQSGLRAVCTKCAASWKIKFKESTWDIPKKFLGCPRGCTPLAPIDEVKRAILASILPNEVSLEVYTRAVEGRRKGWVAAPRDIDLEAEAEGNALSRFIARYLIKKPASKAARAGKNARATRAAVRAIDDRPALPPIHIEVPAMYAGHARPD